MNEQVTKSIPTPVEFFLDGRRFLQYGISPVKIASLLAEERKRNKVKRTEPIYKDGVAYIRASDGRLVRLEHFDPETMEKYTLTPDAVLSREVVNRMEDFALKAEVVDEDCPELSDEQISSILQKAIEQRKARK